LIAQGDEFMTTTETWPGRVALMVAQCAGMVDLVALPIWIGTLIVYYKFDPQQAGVLPRSFSWVRSPRPVWFAIGGISCMALVQAMMSSFLERIGSDRGFGFEAVTGVLITLGLHGDGSVRLMRTSMSNVLFRSSAHAR
jgi:hypothetical protein